MADPIELPHSSAGIIEDGDSATTDSLLAPSDGTSSPDVHDPRRTIVLVEDDRRLAKSIQEYLGAHGFATTTIYRGDQAAEAIDSDPPDLVILDLMLPGLDGLSICKQLRPRYLGPVLMLTARGDSVDEIIGLEVGADDYLAKPVEPRLLLARIRALLRRVDHPGEPSVLEAAGVRVNPANRTVTVDGAPLELTTAEFDLLLDGTQLADLPTLESSYCDEGTLFRNEFTILPDQELAQEELTLSIGSDGELLFRIDVDGELLLEAQCSE